jgi:DNA-binding transcriptional LysR family regulator
LPNAASSVAWDDFRLIKAIAEARSLPAAAELIGLNHSTVFRRLGQIEENLGTRLFERHRSGYVPTPAGEEMAVLAERLETDIAGFTRRLAGREILPAGELRVTTNDSLLVELLTPLFAAFMRQCPDIKLDILLGNQALNLSKRDADVAIRATDNPPENLIGRRVAQIGWALYGRATDFPEGAPADQAELTQQRWISLGDQFSNFKVVQYRQKHIPADQTVYKLNTVLGLAEAVEAGIGYRLPALLYRRQAPRPYPPGATPDRLCCRSVAADPSRLAPLATRSALSRFHGPGTGQAAGLDGRRPDRPGERRDALAGRGLRQAVRPPDD